jgi:hypothetical protein
MFIIYNNELKRAKYHNETDIIYLFQMSKLTIPIIQVCVYQREQEGCDGSQGSQLSLSYIIFRDKMEQSRFKYDILSLYCKKTNKR